MLNAYILLTCLAWIYLEEVIDGDCRVLKEKSENKRSRQDASTKGIMKMREEMQTVGDSGLGREGNHDRGTAVL
jgi:hypothetical protein